MISRFGLSFPDGVRVSPDQKYLYVTDFIGNQWSALLGVASEIGSPAIYRYDLDADMRPTNRQFFWLSEEGRVWTAEGDGVVVRRPDGKILGVFNSLVFGNAGLIPIANFALAGDVLVILGGDNLFTIQLGEVVNSGKPVRNSKSKRWSLGSLC